MTEIIISAPVILILAAIIIAVFYHFGFIDFIHPMNKAEDNQIKVACVGDSITFGCTVCNRDKNNYPAVLGRMLGGKYCVNNFGYTNRTAIKTADYPYTNEKLYRQSLEFKPDIAVIMLGANDTKGKNWNSEKFYQDYSEIIESYLALSSLKRLYVLTPLPMFEKGKKVMWDLRKEIVADQVLPAVKKIADEKGAQCVDVYSAFENRKELFSDGVHPNRRGSRLLAEKVYEAIKKDSDFI